MKKLTSSGGVIVNKDKILLLKKEREWVFPKGKLKENESLIDASLREIFEETGLLVKEPKTLIGKTKYSYFLKGEKIEKEVFYFLFIVDDLKVKIEDSFLGYGWFYFDEALKTLTYKNDKKILKSAIKKIRETNVSPLNL
ncbi:MAG: NUDIX domain-containing protein [Caldisericia bacterium]